MLLPVGIELGVELTRNFEVCLFFAWYLLSYSPRFISEIYLLEGEKVWPLVRSLSPKDKIQLDCVVWPALACPISVSLGPSSSGIGNMHLHCSSDEADPQDYVLKLT
jgi:hypothetical protein